MSKRSSHKISDAVGTAAYARKPVKNEFKIAQQPDFLRLQRALTRARKFALFFVRINLPDYVPSFTKELVQNLPRPVRGIDLRVSTAKSEAGSQETLDPVLTIPESAQRFPSEAVVIVSGLEYWLSSNDLSRQRQTLNALNWCRSELARTKRPLVFVVPDFVITLLIEDAPDFWDFHSGVYTFTLPSTSLQEMEDRFILGDDHSLSSLPVAEKKQRIILLEGMSDEYREAGAAAKGALARTTYQLAQLHESVGNYQHALDHAQSALDLFNKIDDQEVTANCLHIIGTLHLRRGDYATALKYLKDSLKIQQEIGDKSGEGTTLNNISQIYDARGDYDTALNYLKDSLKIRQELGDKSGASYTLHNMAMIAYQNGEHENFISYETEAYRLALEIQDAYLVYGIGKIWGRILFDAGKKEEGLAILHRSLQIGKQANFPDIAELEQLLQELQASQ